MPGPRPAFHGGFRRQQIGEKNWPRVRRTNVLPLPPTITRTEKPQRRRLRLADYDYSQADAYFVTICSRAHACLFGDVVEGEMLRNAAGNTVVLCWEEIPQHFPKVQLDAFVVMPNHVHGVLLFGENPERAGHARPLQVVVGSFKAAVSRRLGLVWQRSYWERVVRSGDELDQIRAYIEDNPLRWRVDHWESRH
ncbi:MAG: transposase [Bryobacteraceae bacterium]